MLENNFFEDEDEIVLNIASMMPKSSRWLEDIREKLGDKNFNKLRIEESSKSYKIYILFKAGFMVEMDHNKCSKANIDIIKEHFDKWVIL